MMMMNTSEVTQTELFPASSLPFNSNHITYSPPNNNYYSATSFITETLQPAATLQQRRIVNTVYIQRNAPLNSNILTELFEPKVFFVCLPGCCCCVGNAF